MNIFDFWRFKYYLRWIIWEKLLYISYNITLLNMNYYFFFFQLQLRHFFFFKLQLRHFFFFNHQLPFTIILKFRFTFPLLIFSIVVHLFIFITLFLNSFVPKQIFFQILISYSSLFTFGWLNCFLVILSPSVKNL